MMRHISHIHPLRCMPRTPASLTNPPRPVREVTPSFCSPSRPNTLRRPRAPHIRPPAVCGACSHRLLARLYKRGHASSAPWHSAPHSAAAIQECARACLARERSLLCCSACTRRRPPFICAASRDGGRRHRRRCASPGRTRRRKYVGCVSKCLWCREEAPWAEALQRAAGRARAPERARRRPSVRMHPWRSAGSAQVGRLAHCCPYQAIREVGRTGRAGRVPNTSSHPAAARAFYTLTWP